MGLRTPPVCTQGFLTSTCKGFLKENGPDQLQPEVELLLKELRATARTPTQQQDRIREECFAGGRFNDDAGERSRMLANNERLSKGTDRLKNAHQVTLDMENTANSILGDLSKQRETLMHAKGTMRYAMEGLDTSGRILSQMARRAAMNKLTLYVVIAVLLVMLICVWFTGGGDSAAKEAGGGAQTGTGTSAGWERAGKPRP